MPRQQQTPPARSSEFFVGSDGEFSLSGGRPARLEGAGCPRITGPSLSLAVLGGGSHAVDSSVLAFLEKKEEEEDVRMDQIEDKILKGAPVAADLAPGEDGPRPCLPPRQERGRKDKRGGRSCRGLPSLILPLLGTGHTVVTSAQRVVLLKAICRTKLREDQMNKFICEKLIRMTWAVSTLMLVSSALVTVTRASCPSPGGVSLMTLNL